ncbi:hypothetical protein C8R45DRAFT_380723 [Mycena sanguinolenta]|nr:hypothetical protein C8R45DRAFT_380723 [Mycena sanguinolenta]
MRRCERVSLAHHRRHLAGTPSTPCLRRLVGERFSLTLFPPPLPPAFTPHRRRVHSAASEYGKRGAQPVPAQQPLVSPAGVARDAALGQDEASFALASARCCSLTAPSASTARNADGAGQRCRGSCAVVLLLERVHRAAVPRQPLHAAFRLQPLRIRHEALDVERSPAASPSLRLLRIWSSSPAGGDGEDRCRGSCTALRAVMLVLKCDAGQPLRVPFLQPLRTQRPALLPCAPAAHLLRIGYLERGRGGATLPWIAHRPWRRGAGLERDIVRPLTLPSSSLCRYGLWRSTSSAAPAPARRLLHRRLSLLPRLCIGASLLAGWGARSDGEEPCHGS